MPGSKFNPSRVEFNRLIFDCKILDPNLIKNCFGADNFVTLKNNTRKPIMQVNVGDVVKSIDSNGVLVDSEVVAILHKETHELGKFLNVMFLIEVINFFNFCTFS